MNALTDQGVYTRRSRWAFGVAPSGRMADPCSAELLFSDAVEFASRMVSLRSNNNRGCYMKLPLAVRASCLVLALCYAVTAAAQPRLPEGITRVTSVEGIVEYKLDNGLQVLLFRDP